MNSVQDLSVLHRRYSDLSHRFRAGWTFHQFLQSLGKSILQQQAEADYSTDFQGLYSGLKEVSQSLNASESERIRGRLEAIDRRLTELMATLDEEDNRVSPDVLRQFFRRVKTYDDKILTQLVKFYLYAQRGGSWAPDRLDKVDFLLARMSEQEDERTGEVVLCDPPQLGEIFDGFWALLGAEPPAPAVVAERRAAIEAIRHEAQKIDSLDRLNESALIRRYRDLKHELGTLFFEPYLLLAIQETNLVLKNRIQKLYHKEEQRIVAEYQRIFELEREVPTDREMDIELGELRNDIERFERKLQSQEFKLEDIAQIRQKVRALLPRLTAGRPEPPGQNVPRPLTSTGDHILAAATKAVEAPLETHEDLLGDYYRRVVDALRDLNPDLPPERVVLIPEIFPLRLEAREVEAYRRLFSHKPCDRELEQFLLEAAALRVRVNEEAQEITSILDETSITGDSPVFVRARQTARLADSYLWRFSHILGQALLGTDTVEIRHIEVLRMRLMRDYSGLWLLVYKPFFTRRTGGTLG